MKKKLIALTLCVLTLCLCLSACGNKDAEVKAALTASKWETEEPLDEDILNMILDDYYFEEEEIAFADSENFTLAKVYTFREDGTALLEYDRDKIYHMFYNEMDHFLSTLYANRGELVEVYGEDDFEDEGDFKDFIAWCISNEGWETVEELLDGFGKDATEVLFVNDVCAPMEMTYKVKRGMVEVYDGEDMWDELTYNADKGTLVSTVDAETFKKAGGSGATA